MNAAYRIVAACVIGLALARSTQATEVDVSDYTGSVTWDTGIYATPNWNQDGTELSWQVSQNGNVFTYSYTWTTAQPTKELSHIIIQVSNDAKLADFSNFLTDPEVTEITLDTHTEGNDNPGLPSDLYGIKFDLADNATTFTFSFDSIRMPMWGDFYAKDGVVKDEDDVSQKVYAYNVGFGGEAFLDDDGNYIKIVVPDTRTTTTVPDGGTTVVLLGAAMLGMGCLARRRA